MTYILIGITALFSYVGFTKPGVKEEYMLNPYLIVHRKQYYRIFSSAFLHADWGHLLFNMITLYFFGSAMQDGVEYGVEPIFKILFGNKLGILYYLILYIGGFMFASLPALIKHKDNINYNALGASGAVSAVLFASILFSPYSSLYIFLIPVPIPAIVFGVGYLFYSAYMAKRNTDNIAHDAHFLGAIFGFLFQILLKPELFNYFINSL